MGVTEEMTQRRGRLGGLSPARQAAARRGQAGAWLSGLSKLPHHIDGWSWPGHAGALVVSWHSWWPLGPGRGLQGRPDSSPPWGSTGREAHPAWCHPHGAVLVWLENQAICMNA